MPRCSWRHKEAALFQLQQIVDEHKSESRAIHTNVLEQCIEYVATAMNEGKQSSRWDCILYCAVVLRSLIVLSWSLSTRPRPYRYVYSHDSLDGRTRR